MDLIIEKEDLIKRSGIVKNGSELWIDIGGGEDEKFEKYGHFGASLTFRKTQENKWELVEIIISTPIVYSYKKGEKDFEKFNLIYPQDIKCFC